MEQENSNTELLNSDAGEVSSEPIKADSEAAVEQTAEITKQPEPEVPFHEHPRWKEVMQEKNDFARRVEIYEQEMSRMRNDLAKFQEASKPKAEDPLLQRLKGIDPEFGARFESVDQLKNQYQALQEKIQSMEMANIRNEAQTTLSKLHGDHGVTAPELQQVYENQVRAIAMSNPNLGVKDLPGVYKQVHDNMSKLVDAVRRLEREQYVPAKKADTKVPSNTKTAAKANANGAERKYEFSKNPDEARQQVIKRVLELSRSGNDL